VNFSRELADHWPLNGGAVLLLLHNKLNFKEFGPQFSSDKQSIVLGVIGNTIEDINPATAIFWT
jgi:hypothetical protein